MRAESSQSSQLSCDYAYVLQEVKQLVAQQIKIAPEEIREDSQLEADLGFDSLENVELVMNAEEHFDIAIPEDVAQQIRTVGDAAHGVMQLLGSQQAG